MGEGKETFRKVSRYLWVVVAVAGLYTGWTFFSRWQENERFEERATEKKRAADRQIVERMGEYRFEILQFYVIPSIVRSGEPAQLCYGVAKTKVVRVTPEVGEVWPAASRCIRIAPTRDTTYTLTAEDEAGETKTATVEVRVR